MNESKNVKALKKQLAAAIAMVCVAAVALGSSTYAWFVSNNTVKGTTTNISAQSNAAFMVIDKTVTSQNSGTEASYEGNAKPLYPAKVDLIANAVTTGDGEKGYVMQSAFASDAGATTMKTETLFDIVGTADANGITGTAVTGTADAAVQSQFAIKQTFYIGEKTGTTELKNLRVSDVKMTVDSTEKDLTNAMRVLVICGDNWIVYNGTGVKQLTNITEDANGKFILKTDGFKGVGTTNQVKVDMYVYYDGDDTNVYTKNLAQLQTAHGLTVSFTADNTAAGGSTGSTGTYSK
ncbi:hypothetical protein [Ruminococcus hominis]|uniref:SipW-cognate class signal peptide n=1 Tax=Ruminococcus hominis TaxID=2763065 RepID=A0ABR7G7Z6_9FIRM|nr:hypothetical protein [Ruminococcus hominis]MBC5683562.1 hypothetical protein [Ruminococcus hominis]